MISYRESDFLYSFNSPQTLTFDAHLHRYYEFLLFLKGDAAYMIENCEYRASDGDLFITRPGELHSIAFTSPRQYVRHFIQISESYFPENEFDFLWRLRESGGGKISAQAAKKYDVEDHFNAVKENIAFPRPESRAVIRAHVTLLLDKVNSILLTSLPNRDDLVYSDKVENARKYINENLEKNFSLDKMAGDMHVSKYYLCHLFRGECGMTIKEYQNLRRISRAKELLEKGEKITSIYKECGFSDYSLLYRAFRKTTGKSPKEFLKNKRQDVFNA
ncbi:MAG: AraC family transcriptional regulator [Clostridia bacterium]|nr:AraC family transcriptional regulator [Clostridia bacterium]